jgi:hypothetical protein
MLKIFTTRVARNFVFRHERENFLSRNSVYNSVYYLYSKINFSQLKQTYLLLSTLFEPRPSAREKKSQKRMPVFGLQLLKMRSCWQASVVECAIAQIGARRDGFLWNRRKFEWKWQVGDCEMLEIFDFCDVLWILIVDGGF